MAKKRKGFLVLIPCRVKDNKPFKPGDILLEADALKMFGSDVIANWLQIGVLIEAE